MKNFLRKAPALMALLILLIAAFAACTKSPQPAPLAAAPNAATPAAAAAVESSPPPNIPGVPTPDPRREEGGSVDKRIPPSTALPHVTRKVPAITEQTLTE